MDITKLIEDGIDLYDAQEYTDATHKLNEALNNILNKTKNINKQINAPSWLSICYLKQSIENSHIDNTYDLFFQAVEDHKKLFTGFKKLINDEKDIENQNYILFWLMQCHLSQAIVTSNTKDADKLFMKAIDYCQKWLTLANELEEEDSVYEKINAEYWLGQCYFEQALKTPSTNIADKLFEQAAEHYQNRNYLARDSNTKTRLNAKIETTLLLGRCYLEYAIKTRDIEKTDKFLLKNIKDYQELLVFLKEHDKEIYIQDKINAEHWLGRCYFEQAIRTKDIESADKLFEFAIEHYQQQFTLAQTLPEPFYAKEQFTATFWLGRSHLAKNKAKNTIPKNEKDNIRKYFNQAKKLCDQLPDRLLSKESKEKHINIIKIYERELEFFSQDYKKYFELKKKDIQKHLNLNKNLEEVVASILAVLSISPIEFNKPLAHYTSPLVCEKLLGIKQKVEKQYEIIPSKMRMNSSTYMNDPYEGKSLLDFLGIQENSLENKTEFSPYNAFFTCFSTRINDLNQFRLYGKVDNIEASGCCLVFNKGKNWVKEPDISRLAEYQNTHSQSEKKEKRKKQSSLQFADLLDFNEHSLPLYQVSYIFYLDEYTKQDEYDVLKDKIGKNFGVRLKPISDAEEWHKEREKQLQDALEKLQKHFHKNNKTEEQQQADQSALEYIRYLFKDYAFRDEEEFRLLKIEELGSDKVKYCPETNSAYVEYADICYKLDEVILGTNYERAGGEQKVEAFRYLLKQKLPHIKVSHSSLPINAALPARKP
ncbi:hypothetical protein [Neisseria animaloris]|uniref:hypothetical protein n=1 Tax=Neisseria animaloris TaxID=326522 RepID=UPI000D3A787D|nr:hypothetical protein [Neisseria animaloris]